MARKKKLKPSEVVEALKQSHGLKTGAAEILGVSFPTIERYIADSEEAREIVEHWRVRRKDRAEYKLDEAIERGDGWALMFTLKNARDREYSEKVELTGKDGEPLIPKEENIERLDRAVSTFAHALGEILSGTGAKRDGEVDAPK
jgi:hypothetical protein